MNGLVCSWLNWVRFIIFFHSVLMHKNKQKCVCVRWFDCSLLLTCLRNVKQLNLPKKCQHKWEMEHTHTHTLVYYSAFRRSENVKRTQFIPNAQLSEIRSYAFKPTAARVFYTLVQFWKVCVNIYVCVRFGLDYACLFFIYIGSVWMM